MTKITARVAVIAAMIAALFAETASAALEPGTPVTVAPGVPDNGRAWELVTPPDPVNAQVAVPRAIAPSGNEIDYSTAGPLPGAATGSPILSPNIARRGADGWTTTPVTSPYPELAPALFYGANAFDPELTQAIFSTPFPHASKSAQELGLFRGTPDGKYEQLAAIDEGGAFGGTSTDLQHVLFTTSKHLLPADATRTSGQSVYEAVGSALRLVDVANDGSLLSPCGSNVYIGKGSPGLSSEALPSPISRDGKRIFFTTRPSCAGPTRAYLRVDGTTTVEISATQCDLAGCAAEEGDVSITGVTPSGSSAFLVTAQRLTDDDPDTSTDLYRYDVDSGHLTLLTAGAAATDISVFATTVIVSEDGSRVYFMSFEDSNGRLYLADSDGVHLISPNAEKLEVSANGRYAVFTTVVPLVEGDDDSNEDVYRYDAETGVSQRISTGSEGGNGKFGASDTTTSGQVVTHPNRAMTEDGSDIFFTTAEQLLPQDGNEVRDVYEWANGRLGLISSGRGDQGAAYVGATPDGRTVFFKTTDTLLARDRDGGDVDLYAARVGGGFPEAPPTAACSGDSCRAPDVGPPIDRATPKSAKPLAGRILLRRLDPAARRRIAETGWIRLLAEVPRPGRLAAQARAKTGRRIHTIASSSVAVPAAGPVRLRMQLSREARRALAAGRRLEVLVVLRLTGLRATGRIHLDLGGGR